MVPRHSIAAVPPNAEASNLLSDGDGMRVRVQEARGGSEQAVRCSDPARCAEVRRCSGGGDERLGMG